MFRRDFVSRRTSYSHLLWDKFQKVHMSTDQVRELVDLKDWEELILVHGYSALLRAGMYIASNGDVDTIVSAAMLGLCVAVDKMKSPDFENVNPRGYIMSFIHQYCYEALTENNVIKPCWRGRQCSMRPIIDAIDGDAEEIFNLIEFDEVMELIVKSDFERAIIDFRRIGYTDSEIATTFEISRSTVSRTRKSLYERYLNYVKCIDRVG